MQYIKLYNEKLTNLPYKLYKVVIVDNKNKIIHTTKKIICSNDINLIYKKMNDDEFTKQLFEVHYNSFKSNRYAIINYKK